MRFRGAQGELSGAGISSGGGGRGSALPCGRRQVRCRNEAHRRGWADFRRKPAPRRDGRRFVRITKLDARPPCARRGLLALGKAREWLSATTLTDWIGPQCQSVSRCGSTARPDVRPEIRDRRLTLRHRAPDTIFVRQIDPADIGSIQTREGQAAAGAQWRKQDF